MAQYKPFGHMTPGPAYAVYYRPHSLCVNVYIRISLQMVKRKWNRKWTKFHKDLQETVGLKQLQTIYSPRIRPPTQIHEKTLKSRSACVTLLCGNLVPSSVFPHKQQHVCATLSGHPCAAIWCLNTSVYCLFNLITTMVWHAVQAPSLHVLRFLPILSARRPRAPHAR